MWQFREAVRGIAEGCKTLGIPVTGGNVSFYNQTGDVAIHPTPVIGVLGVMEDVSTPDLDRVPDRRLVGVPHRRRPATSWTGPSGRTSSTATSAAARRSTTSTTSSGWPASSSRRPARRLVDAAHDLSEGGLAQALCESVLRHGVGVKVSLKHVHEDAFVALFSESAGRVVVSVVPGSDDALLALVQEAGLPVARIGTVDTYIRWARRVAGRDDRIEAAPGHPARPA